MARRDLLDAEFGFLEWFCRYGRSAMRELPLGVYGMVWMATLAVVPALVGQAIDLGVADRDTGAGLNPPSLAKVAERVGCDAATVEFLYQQRQPALQLKSFVQNSRSRNTTALVPIPR